MFWVCSAETHKVAQRNDKALRMRLNTKLRNYKMHLISKEFADGDFHAQFDIVINCQHVDNSLVLSNTKIFPRKNFLPKPDPSSTRFYFKKILFSRFLQNQFAHKKPNLPK